jgi:hypothetical protein
MRLKIILMLVASLVILTSLAVLVLELRRPLMKAQAGACTLIVPNAPLTAKGLATPYQLEGCNENDPNTSAFVQADVFDPATKALTTYSPLVVTQGSTPLAAPIIPTLPQDAVVALWFGFDATVLHLRNAVGCQQFEAQFAYCNAPTFFAEVNAARVTIQPLGVALNGQPCPSVRSASIVDQDQSDNVQTQYLAVGPQTAQDTPSTLAMYPGATILGNPSDNALLTTYIDPAIGCKPWLIPSLTGGMSATLATDELQAAAYQPAPQMLVPLGDPMVHGSQKLTQLYRLGVDQNVTTSDNTTEYCGQLVDVGFPGLAMQATALAAQPAPFGATGTLWAFMVTRYQASLGLLKCQ